MEKEKEKKYETQEELGKIIRNVGLNPEKWLAIFQNKLNVMTQQPLEHMGRKEYEKLKPNCNHDWEKEALKKLLGIESFLAKITKNRKAPIQHEYEHPSPEDKMKSYLEVEEESKPDSDDQEFSHNVVECAAMKREDILDEEVIQNASGGLSLDGIFLSNKDILKKREKLIAAPESIKLANPCLKHLHQDFQFSSKKEEQELKKRMATLRLSMSCSANVGGPLGFDMRPGASAQFEPTCQSSMKSNNAKKFMHNVRFTYFPVKSFFFTEDSLCLSPSALKALHLIEESEVCEQPKKCLEFFERFGSHAIQGPIHFGGIFWENNSAESVESGDTDERKNLTSNNVKMSVAAGFLKPILGNQAEAETILLNPSGNIGNNQQKNYHSNKQCSISKIGGPVEVDSLQEWKKGLVDNKKTWEVIDRGSQTIPVWKIILKNHRSDFKNPLSVVKCLEETYTTLSHNEEYKSIEETKPENSNLSEKTGLAIFTKDDDRKEIESKNESQQSLLKEQAQVNIDVNKQKTHENTNDIVSLSTAKNEDIATDPLSESKHNNQQPGVPLTERQMSILERLGIKEYYPNKMSLSDVLVVEHINSDCNYKENELVLIFLQKLLMLDCTLREVFYPVKVVSNENKVNDHSSSKGFEKFMFGKGKKEIKTKPNEQHIHPMDIQMAIFFCADSFLWQYVAGKLAFCQYSLPLFVPNPLSLEMNCPSWSFLPLRKSWKFKTAENSTCLKENQSMFSASLSTVLVFRFGRGSISKSQILNSLLNKKKHNTFFHRDCKGSNSPPLLMDGVVETAWYIPRGESEDSFPDCTTFLNLHGDARKMNLQLDLLTQKASIVVVVLQEKDFEDELSHESESILRELYDSPTPLICLCADEKKEDAEEQDPGDPKLKIPAKDRNEADLLDELQTGIHCLLQKSHKKYSIDRIIKAGKSAGYQLDMDEDDCATGQKCAASIISKLKNENLRNVKEKFMPLQGELWSKWCRKQKELNVSSPKDGVSIENHLSAISGEKKCLRMEQVKKAFPMNAVIKEFLQIIEDTSSNDLKFFLKWIEILLNELTAPKISELDTLQLETWSKKQALKQKSPNTDQSICQIELDKITSDKHACMLSFQHFLRETGQIYESMICDKSLKDSVEYLPDIVANMMILGYPIELMDGDTSHIPLEWISSVLDRVRKKIGEKKLFVISVLGVQSTGKSTLLNAMFGLEFSVSAGRCTKGAFMQLIKVSEKLKQEKKIDYLLIIDTEGLKSLEASKTSYSHDNELATFVIGLGNLTLINIMGENPSEMQDFLQIAVHAFLRMKLVKLSPNCMFIHQNVGDVSANDKNLEGKMKLLEKLDEQSRAAAADEKCVDVKCFNDVIRFDEKTHIHYFSHLWDGSPPMAPPNTRYSQDVQKLKQNILSYIAPEFTLTISDFQTRVQDLWSALLKENFVFSFRNTIEIAANRKRGDKYAEWAWKLRSKMLEIELKVTNKIERGERLVVTELMLGTEINEEYEIVKKEMENFFSKEVDKDILIQWKAKTEKQVSDVKEQVVTNTLKKLDKLIQQKKVCNLLNERKRKYEDELLKRSKELALTLRMKGIDELEDEFNKLWSDWVTEVSREAPRVSECNVRIDIENIIFDSFRDINPRDLQQKLKLFATRSKEAYFYLDLDKHISIMSSGGFRSFGSQKMITPNEASKLTDSLTENINISVTEYVLQKKHSKTDYSETLIYEVVKLVKDKIEYFQASEKRFLLKKEFCLDLTILLCYLFADIFQEMRCVFQDANNPIKVLKSRKEIYFETFSTFCKGATTTTELASLVGSRLKEAIRKSVYGKAKVDLANEIRSNMDAFRGNRSNLEKHILRSLAESEKFDDFIQYIKRPKDYFEQFISDSVLKYCWDTKSRPKGSFFSRWFGLISEKNESSTPGKQTRIIVVFLDCLKHFKTRVNYAIQNSTKVVSGKNGNVSMWLGEFCKELTDLPFTRDDLKFVEFQDIKDVKFLEEAMEINLENVAKDLEKEILKETLNSTTFSTKEIQIEILNNLCGCWSKCPFCSTLCTNTIPDHDGDHSVDLHRPQGVNGVKWYKTDNFTTDICSSLVGSDCNLIITDNGEEKEYKYKEYRTAGPKYASWSITPDTSLLPYWKWFVCKFQSNLEAHYSTKFQGMGEIPEEWQSITKDEAIESLNLNE